MNYIKDYQQDHPTNYISVNELIKPKRYRDDNDSPREKTAPFSNLRVSQPGDPAEIAADRIAGEVTGGATVTIPAKLNDRNGAIQAKESASSDSEPSEKFQTLKDSSGVPLPENSKVFFEEKMGANFSQVRIHNDRQAHESAAAINAKAFTVGNRIAFGKGEYNPGSRQGQQLLAHELAHVAQGGAGIHKKDNDALDKGRDVGRATGGVIEVEAILRNIYQRTDEAIVREADYMLSKGVPANEVAKWVVETRNITKVKIRQWDLDVLRLLAEKSNERIYGNKIGPSYEDLRTGTRNNVKGAKPPKTDLEIIEGAKVTRASVNKWLGRLRIAGRIMIAIDIGISGYRVIVADPEDRPKVLIKEASRFAGALAGGWGGAKLGGMIGGAIGAWIGGAGAVPGAAIGAIIGGIGGAIGGGFLGEAAGDLLIYQLYPPKETEFEGVFR